ncbi:hypothetical protein T484DRAFT_1817712 [Baffinella frigidus]|nr:hypothetical protein T484DRAFT_1817712 [Cryptophyta sp. CCMP2293]
MTPVLSFRDSCGVLGWKLRAKRRRVWDAFTFFNELLVLEPGGSKMGERE